MQGEMIGYQRMMLEPVSNHVSLLMRFIRHSDVYSLISSYHLKVLASSMRATLLTTGALVLIVVSMVYH